MADDNYISSLKELDVSYINTHNSGSVFAIMMIHRNVSWLCLS